MAGDMMLGAGGGKGRGKGGVIYGKGGVAPHAGFGGRGNGTWLPDGSCGDAVLTACSWPNMPVAVIGGWMIGSRMCTGSSAPARGHFA